MRFTFCTVMMAGAGSPAKMWSGKRAVTTRSRREARPADHPTKTAEVISEKIRKSRLLPVFHAAKATSASRQRKMRPPPVSWTGKSRRAASSRAERASGGTTKTSISRTKTSETSAPVRASSQSPDLRAQSVTAAVAAPPNTTSVPSAAPRQPSVIRRNNILSTHPARAPSGTRPSGTASTGLSPSA